MSCSCGRDHNNTGDTGPSGDVTQAQLAAGLATKYNVTGGTISGSENVTGTVSAQSFAITGALGTTGLTGSNVNSSFLESALLNMKFPPGSSSGLSWNVQDGNTTCFTVNNAANGAGIGTTGTIGSTAGSLILGNGITSFTTTLTQGAPTSAITLTLPSTSGTLALTNQIPLGLSYFIYANPNGGDTHVTFNPASFSNGTAPTRVTVGASVNGGLSFPVSTTWMLKYSSGSGFTTTITSATGNTLINNDYTGGGGMIYLISGTSGAILQQNPVSSITGVMECVRVV